MIHFFFFSSHHSEAGWDAGRPYIAEDPHATQAMTDSIRSSTDASFTKTKQFGLPTVGQTLHLCNGLDVVNRTSFDHMYGWYSLGSGFSFDLTGEGQPYVISVANRMGGKPESLDLEDLKRLQTTKLYVNNIHYQGDTKRFLLYDICRLLVLTGDKHIEDPAVAKHCSDEEKKHPGWPCQDHPGYAGTKPDICI